MKRTKQTIEHFFFAVPKKKRCFNVEYYVIDFHDRKNVLIKGSSPDSRPCENMHTEIKRASESGKCLRFVVKHSESKCRNIVARYVPTTCMDIAVDLGGNIIDATKQ